MIFLILIIIIIKIYKTFQIKFEHIPILQNYDEYLRMLFQEHINQQPYLLLNVRYNLNQNQLKPMIYRINDDFL